MRWGGRCASIQAVVTLLHFPLLLCLAYGADRNWNFSGEDNKVQPQLSMMESTVRLTALSLPGFSSSLCQTRINALTHMFEGRLLNPLSLAPTPARLSSAAG